MSNKVYSIFSSHSFHEMARYIFATIGGCGSTYLIDRLSKKYDVGDKPDAVFQPILKPLGIDPGTFEQRSKGFITKQGDTLEEILPEYIDYIRKHSNVTAVFNFVAENHLFSKLKIEDVIFQVRHPLHAYISFAKPSRHKAKIDYYGGINSEKAIEYYCRRWIALVEEYKNLHFLGMCTWLLRFEYLNLDINQLPKLKWIYRDFDSSRRNTSPLSQESENYLKELVSPTYVKIYDEWDI